MSNKDPVPLNTIPGRTMDLTIRRGSLHNDHDLEYFEYFLSRSIEERLAAMEQLRAAMHGPDCFTSRLSLSDIVINCRDR